MSTVFKFDYGHSVKVVVTAPASSGSVCAMREVEGDRLYLVEYSDAGGANAVSLLEARRNFRELGASERQALEQVRAPRPDEVPTGMWTDNSTRPSRPATTS